MTVQGTLARLREHAEGKSRFLAICSGLSIRSVLSSKALQEALCLEVAYWAWLVQTESYVRVEQCGFVVCWFVNRS